MSLAVTAMHDTAGAVTGHLTVGTDVTVQRLAERGLVESEARFRLDLRHRPDRHGHG